MPQNNDARDETLISQRAALILLLAGVVGAAVGVLTLLSGAAVAPAVLAGGSAFGGAVIFFHMIVG
ncbi:hypothetical protein ACWCQN_40570 [Streptomyces sp. NPDC001984]